MSLVSLNICSTVSCHFLIDILCYSAIVLIFSDFVKQRMAAPSISEFCKVLATKFFIEKYCLVESVVKVS